VTGDVDNDGANDVAIAASSDAAAQVCLNDGTGALGAPQTYASGFFTIAVDLGDLTGDGWLDLTASSFASRIYSLFPNNQNGQFGARTTLPALGSASCTVLHDFDGDGDLDVTAIDEVADMVYLYRQDG
jgi:hypothetical protein